MDKGKKKLDYIELNVFCEQIVLMLKAGVSVYEGICILGDEATSVAEQEFYRGIVSALDEGIVFPQALMQSEVFPEYMINMIVIGEASGRLETVLHQLARYYKREQAMKESIRYAITYPMVMMIMMSLVIGILVVKVLPIFNSVFIELGSELTGFSKAVMEMGTVLSGSLEWILGVFIILSLSIIISIRTSIGQKYFQTFQENFFLTKKLSEKMAVSRFASGMSLMLASGLDTEQSLDMILPLINHREMEAKIDKVRQEVIEGKDFAEAVTNQEVFSHIYNRMIGMGYRGGAVDEVIDSIAERYESEIEISLSNMIAIIEPSLVAILSVVVGVILLSVMLPLMSIMSVI